MSLRFWRRITIFPGVTLNLSKSGVSLSFGIRGARYTIGKDKDTASVGAPGTGVSYRKNISKKKKPKLDKKSGLRDYY